MSLQNQSTATLTPEQKKAADSADKAKKKESDRRFKSLEMTMKRHHYQADALIEVLHKAQDTFGYLEEDVLRYVAQGLKLPLSRVYGVATFYHLFTLKPNGAHTCVVCLGTACHVKGGSQLLAELEDELGVKVGETAEDGSISLLGARCIGACGLAPAIVLDGAVCGKQSTDEAIDRIRGVLAQ
ncbi:MAG: bidirectional hydrogenase complex protein HoxE [Leptolyngbyaceae bacterium]|nr:bidirectional hydrogenase complex protein HoxE [Leptolyngbyaceae bacterium]